MSRTDLHFRLRIPDEIKKKVEVSAANHNRSMTAEIVSILETHLSTNASLPSLVERLEAAVKALEEKI